jgi:hypothetical protein
MSECSQLWGIKRKSDFGPSSQLLTPSRTLPSSRKIVPVAIFDPFPDTDVSSYDATRWMGVGA